MDSSNLSKTYTVKYSPDDLAIMTNDNGSFWQGYLGYPGIAFLLMIGEIEYDRDVSRAMAGINWNTVNKKFKRDYDKAIEYALQWAQERGVERERVVSVVEKIESELAGLGLEKLGKRMRPPTKNQP